MRWRRAILAIAAAAVLIALLVLIVEPGAHQSRSAPLRGLWSGSQIHRAPLTFGHATAPPQPLDAKGVPALLSSDPRVKRNYLADLAHRLPSVRAPAAVGFFGQVQRSSSTELIVHRDELSVSFPGASFTSVRPFVHGSTIAVRVTPHTELLLGSERLGSLPPGAEVFLGGSQYGRLFQARLVALATQMQRPASTSSSGATTATPAAAVSAPSYQLTAQRTTAASTSHPNASPAGQTGGVAGNVEGQQSPNSVLLHDKTGVLSKLPAFSFNPHFDATVGISDVCELGAHADLLIANDYELHWPFQFVQNGNGFSVVSLDKPDPSTFHAGPVTIDSGITDPSNYTVYSGFGADATLNASVSCGVNTPFGHVSVGFGVGAGTVGLGWQNKTVHHVPLEGDRELEVPPNDCGGASLNLGPASVGIEDCQYQTLSGGLFRATLKGSGGSSQGIAVGYTHGDTVQHSTAPHGDPVQVDQWSYGDTLRTRMVAGLLINVDPRPFLPYKKKPRITPEQKAAGVFTSAQRHPDQVGPTLKDGSWRDQTGQWHDREANTIPEPSDVGAQIQQANANWIHENQDGATLKDGRWKVKNGGNNPWRYPNGKTAPTPTPQEVADANELTKTDPADGEPDETPDDIHGWDYQTTEGDPGAIAPSTADPSSLLLDLPIQAAPAPPPGPPPSSFVVNPNGTVGSLTVNKSTQADVVATDGSPQAQSKGQVGVPGFPPYLALGYGCSGQSIDTCQTTFYISQATGLLTSFFTNDSRYHTPNGTAVGIATTTAQRQEHAPQYGTCGQALMESTASATLELKVKGGHVKFRSSGPVNSRATVSGGTIAALSLEARHGAVGIQFC